MNLTLSFEVRPNFRYLEKSDNVTRLQEMLFEMGYDIGKAGIDSVFGNDTRTALDEFVRSGKIKKGGNVGEATLKALTQPESMLDGFRPLSWEGGRPERAAWSKCVFETIEMLFDSSFSLCADISTFRSDYNLLSRTQQINVWGELISAISNCESGWNPVSRMVETTMDTDPVTGNQVASEGLLQLSYQDKPNYAGKVEIVCEFDWTADKPLFLKNPKDPNITILDPYKNLKFGIGILAYQIKRRKRIILKRNEGVYWAVIIDGGKYEKINKIASFVEKLQL